MHKSRNKELELTSLDTIRSRFINDIVILPSADAEKMIREHADCPFKDFEFTGECYLNQWYFVAGDGPVREPKT
jgi:hypothetical protein